MDLVTFSHGEVFWCDFYELLFLILILYCQVLLASVPSFCECDVKFCGVFLGQWSRVENLLLKESSGPFKFVKSIQLKKFIAAAV